MRLEVKWQLPVPRTSGAIARELHFNIRNPQGMLVGVEKKPLDLREQVTTAYLFEEGSHVQVDLVDVTASGTINKVAADDFIVAPDMVLPTKLDDAFMRVHQKEIGKAPEKASEPNKTSHR